MDRRWRRYAIEEGVYNIRKDGNKMEAGVYNIKKDGYKMAVGVYNIEKDGRRKKQERME